MPAQPRKPKTVREALIWASSFLRQAGRRDPQFEAELLLRYLLALDRTRFIIALEEELKPAQLEQLERLCQRRAASEPLQYILGEQEFYGRLFTVRPGVLIPRPETEILIEQVLLRAEQLWPETAALDVLDIGTGSGAIALTLAAERPRWRVTTVDLSANALRIARENAKRLQLERRVRFLHGDLAEPLLVAGEQVDLLVSNPPYIPSAEVEQLEAEVKQFEPRLALDGGTDGLVCYRRICAVLPRLLRPTALVAFEVGIRQAEPVRQLLLATETVEHTAIVPDLAGVDRVVLGWRKSN